MKRTIFLLDGFNLYHSLMDASKFFKIKTLKWLDYHKLCSNYLYVIGNEFKEKCCLEKIYYFTSLATHLQKKDPGKVLRHELYIDCLKDSGIKDIPGRFKSKTVYCYKCKNEIIKYEEKETDVAISSKLFEIFQKNECDVAVIITGDTDLGPAIKTSKLLFPDKKIVSCFPFMRKNKELANLSDFSFKINKETYFKCQFPNPYIKKDGTKRNKPIEW